MKTLLIDDDSEFLKFIGKSLESMGITTSAFDCPEKALAILKAEQFNVVITDINMPGINGIEVLKAVRKHNSAARTIVVSGLPDKDLEMIALKNGAYAFFPKPLDVDELLRTISRIKDELHNGQEGSTNSHEAG